MKNQKLVCENLDEYVKTSLNEGFKDKLQGAYDSIKSLIKKIGGRYFAMYNNIKLQLTLPINIGLNFKNKKLGDNAMEYFIPSTAAVELESSLGRFTDEKYYGALVKKAKENHREFNQKYPTIESYVKAHKEKTFESIQNAKALVLNEGIAEMEHSDKNIPTINVKRLQHNIGRKLMHPTGQPLLIWGAPGIGKTAIIKAVLDERRKDGTFISFDAQVMTPEAWFMPYIEHTKVTAGGYKEGDAKYVDLPKGNLPLYKYDRNDPEGNKLRNDAVNDGEGGIIFFDELSRCSIEVQSSCLTLLGNRAIGDFRLGDKWVLFAAANRPEDENDTNAIHFSSTLGNRCQQVNFVPTYGEWKQWGERNGINPILFRYLDHNYEQFWYTKDANDEKQAIFASPRTWADVSESLASEEAYFKSIGEKITKVDITEAIARCVGTNVALEMINFMYIDEEYGIESIKAIWTDASKAPSLAKIGKSKQSLTSTHVTGITVIALNDKKGQTLTPKEWLNFCKWCVSLDNPSAAGYAINMAVAEHSYINPELGDYKKDAQGNLIGTYSEGRNLIEAKYADILTGKILDKPIEDTPNNPIAKFNSDAQAKANNFTAKNNNSFKSKPGAKFNNFKSNVPQKEESDDPWNEVYDE